MDLWYYCYYLLRPLINRKLEEKDCGEGPNLEIIFEDDVHLKEVQEKIIVNAISKNAFPYYYHSSCVGLCLTCSDYFKIYTEYRQ